MRPLYIAGATGTGKSSVALALAAKLGAEVVNADAYQLYQGVEIVSAAPGAAERALVGHHLYGCLGLDEECNAGRFSRLARPVLDSLSARGVRPLVVGGSGLYLKSLTHGLSDLPADPTLRAELEALADDELVARLRGLDPAGAEAVNLRNRRYVMRAVEISILSGRPMSEVKTAWAGGEQPEFDGVILERPRAELYRRIDARVGQMVDAGLLDEVRALPEHLSATAEKAIGIRQVREHLAGGCSLDDCLAEIRQASRRYAKRQLTWFRREAGFQRVCLGEAEHPESAAERVLALFPSSPDV